MNSRLPENTAWPELLFEAVYVDSNSCLVDRSCNESYFAW